MSVAGATFCIDRLSSTGQRSRLMDKKSIALSVSVSAVKPKNKSINNSRAELVLSNQSLANRLNKKKLEAKKLREQLKLLSINIIKYKQYINHLQEERRKLQSTIGAISNNVQSSISTMVEHTMLEADKLKATLDIIYKDLNPEDLENISYLANTTMANDMKLKKIKRLQTGLSKSENKVVNRVRPMKCGYVVGNPVVSLRRILRQPSVTYVPQAPLTNVPEADSDMEVETEPAQAASGTSSSVSSDASSSNSPEPLRSATVGRAQAVPRSSQQRKRAPAVTQTSELHEDSLRFVAPRPKSNRPRPSAAERDRARLSKDSQPKTPNRALQRSKSASTGGKGKKQQQNKAISLKSPAAEDMSQEQRMQIYTPCRVLVKDCISRPLSPHLRVTSPVPSPMLPVVMLDRITTRKKVNSSDDISDHENGEEEMEVLIVESPKNPEENVIKQPQAEPDIEEEEEEEEGGTEAAKSNESNEMDFTLVVPNIEKRASCSPREAEIASVSPKRTSDERKGNLPKYDIMNETRDVVSEVPIFPDPNLSTITVRKRNSSGESSQEEEEPVQARRSLDFDQDIDVTYDSGESKVANAENSTHKSSPQNCSTKSTSSDCEEVDVSKWKPVKLKASKLKVEKEYTLKSEQPKPVKRNRPMPKSAKLRLKAKQNALEDAEFLNEPSRKRIAYENLEGRPETFNGKKGKGNAKRITSTTTSSKRDSDFTTDEDKPAKGKKRQKKTLTESTHSSHDEESCSTMDSVSSGQSGILSPEQRHVYMQQFLERVQTEDPLEGTSRKFEPKKQSNKIVPTSVKKSLRLHTKTTYTESPNSPSVKFEPDESWRPEKPKPWSKKRANKKK